MRGSLVINYDYEYNMELKGSMGARTNINFLSVDKPNPGLGFNLYPDADADGNQLHEFEARVKKVNQNCKAAVSIHLGAYTMLVWRLEP